MLLALRFLIGIVFVASLQRAADGYEPDFDRYDEFHKWTTDERLLLTDLADLQLNQHTLLEASLIVAGHDSTNILRMNDEFDSSIRRCRSREQGTGARRTQLQVIFRHLSQEFLYGEYQPDLYDVGATIANGDFNCLTATILFQALCDAFSIEVDAIWEPSHVQCWAIQTQNSGYLIETTADPDVDAVSVLKSRSELPIRRLSASELLAKVFYNKGVWALKSDRFPIALGSTWVGSLLDPQDSPAQNNLRACFNNWALAAVSRQDDLDLAQKLLEAGLRLDPNYEPFSRNKRLLLGR